MIQEFFNGSKGQIFKKYRKELLSVFLIINILLFYLIVTDVAVVTKKKIIVFSFHYPQGREYSYCDIKKISTGIYGKKEFLPKFHSKGDFFYIIELKNGQKIDLADVGGVNHDKDERFVIEDLDKKLVKMNIPKEASMRNFQYAEKELAKIYTDKIESIIKNK
ncbi:hypothetical protein [Neobacillus terrae]|uniref:hypothetical protein n=1 Tax=Neobacillus terrae TaxID=3034837 RepID=UPI00140848C8|nr:hypothetical protein [Neobacillus terrae]NHM32915.1 hypothetical protein [Neobacillus terrae]